MYSLRDMQMLTESTYSIETTRKDLNSIVDYFRRQPWQEEIMTAVSENLRHLPREILDQSKCFFIPEDLSVESIPEEWRVEAFNLVRKNRFIMAGRFIYPVMDVKGDVMGFCGWDPYVTPKYLDSKNFGYKANGNTLYGMEMLETYYTSGKPVYIVEGIICCLYLRSKGLQALALLGSHISNYCVQIIRRFGKRACIIPDNDAYGKDLSNLDNLAGEYLVKAAKLKLPNAIVCQSKVAKDIDDTRKFNDGFCEKKLLRELSQVMVNPWLPLEIVRVR